MEKKYVSVAAIFSEGGKVLPTALIWEDGRTFEIDKIVDMRKAASLKCGGCGTRYICNIRGKQIALFKDDDRWFMELASEN